MAENGLSPELKTRVSDFLQQMEVHYGTSPRSVHKFFQDLEFSAKQREFLEKCGSWAAKSIITAVACGFGYALWEGFKHMAGK